jgi:hypothetical protein
MTAREDKHESLVGLPAFVRRWAIVVLEISGPVVWLVEFQSRELLQLGGLSRTAA